jgi:hypothetical protein
VTHAWDADGRCSACSDEGVPMRVLESHAGALATCAGDDGGRTEVMTDLVGEVGPGDTLLVHAGVALMRLS